MGVVIAFMGLMRTFSCSYELIKVSECLYSISVNAVVIIVFMGSTYRWGLSSREEMRVPGRAERGRASRLCNLRRHGTMLGLMHHHCCLKMLNNSEQGALHFHFAPDLADYVAGPGVRDRKSLNNVQRGVSELSGLCHIPASPPSPTEFCRHENCHKTFIFNDLLWAS